MRRRSALAIGGVRSDDEHDELVYGGYPQQPQRPVVVVRDGQVIASYSIDCEEDRTLRAVLVGMLAEMQRKPSALLMSGEPSALGTWEPAPVTTRTITFLTEPRLCGLVLNPISDSEPRGRWPVWRGSRRIGRKRHLDDGNRIADGKAEKSGELEAVPFVTLDRVEFCDASSLRPVPVVMLDDLPG